MSADYDGNYHDDEPPDPMDGDGDEFCCSECGNECDPDYGLKHDGMCEECFRDVSREERQEEYDRRYDMGDEDGMIDGVGFADPGGRSALRAATADNPRVHPCPTCGRPNALTPADVRRGYQCDRCADQAERGVP